MSKDNLTAAFGKKGMNRDLHPANLSELNYTWALNANFGSEGYGLNLMLQNEPSNLLCSKFKEGFKVVGFKQHLNRGVTYFFLVNPETNVSEIGFIVNNKDISFQNEDILRDCGCSVKYDLGAELDTINQVEYCNYTTLLEDSCNNCLNFSINHPIKNIVLHEEVTGTVLYWSNGKHNPPRYLNIDRIEDYKINGSESCGEEGEPTCVDCSKMLLFKSGGVGKIEVKSVDNGGRLKMGTYELMFAYCDKNGEEYTNYYSLTSPISIFDKNKRNLEQSEFGDYTNYGISVKLENLSKEYNYFKIGIIFTNGLDGATSYYVGVPHPVTSENIFISNLEEKQAVTLNKLLVKKPTYTHSDSLFNSNGYLFHRGLYSEGEVNLQPVVNLLGSFLRWQTVKYWESLYDDPVSSMKYRGYMRDEVGAFSIRFFDNKGHFTSNFILPNRPKMDYDVEIVDNKDSQSIFNDGGNCMNGGRSEKWQIYNTSSVINYINTDTIVDCNTNPEDCVIVENFKYCFIDEVAVDAGNMDSGNPYTIPFIFDYYNFKQFVNDYKLQICSADSPFYNQSLCNFLSGDYSETHCSPSGISSNCTPPELIEELVFIGDVGEENVVFNEKPLNDYSRIPKPDFCNMYKPDTSNGNEKTEDWETSTAVWINNPDITHHVYVRYEYTRGSDCGAAIMLNEIDLTAGFIPNSFYFNYIHSPDLNDLLTTIPATPLNMPTNIGGTFPPAFFDNVHKNAVWFYAKKTKNSAHTIVEISEYKRKSKMEAMSVFHKVRVSVFDACYGNLITTHFFDKSDGLIFYIDNNDFDSEVKIAVDVGILRAEYDKDYLAGSITGCFNIGIRPIEYESISIFYKNLSFDKREKYKLSCKIPKLKLDSCTPMPHNYGKFGYYESTVTYPDNGELFNSSWLSIDTSEIPENIKLEFTEYFIQEDGDFNDNLDLRCKPIRHFRFPSNEISPYMNTQEVIGKQESIIYPLGVFFEDGVVDYFLDLAVKNGLISAKKRNSIVGYEIFKGDRRYHKSIISKGILFDMFKYEDGGKSVLYSNYPYNDLGDDKLHYMDSNHSNYISHPFGGDKNYLYTYHSPDIYFKDFKKGSEANIEGYLFGQSYGSFTKVENHSKWVILGDSAFRTANRLALAEVILNKTLEIGRLMVELAQTMWFQAGLTFGSGLAGQIVGGIAVGASITAMVANGFIDYGRYRYEWLKIFKEMGEPVNYAEYYTSYGYYNYFKPNDFLGNTLRGLKDSVYLKSGNYSIVEKGSSDTFYINNKFREESVFISFGKNFKLEYPPEYTYFDNTNIDFNSSSRFSKLYNGLCDNKGEIRRNIASPYVSIKEWKSDLYGEVDSVKWLTTGKYVFLSDNTLDNKLIFGGDIYISRFSIKRKFPMFLVDAVGIADLTPFSYSDYSNVINTKYYIDYEVSKITSYKSVLFPTISSTYKVDCNYGDGSFYLPSKTSFYLYYYGIPTFLVESDINLNLRYSGKDLKDNFYPNFPDYIELTQEKNVSIKERNTFYYNPVYSKMNIWGGDRLLPSNYSSDIYDKLTYLENRVIISEQDTSEIDLLNPWLVYKPLNYKDFSSDKGSLKVMKDIESKQILAIFENQFAIYNAIDTLRDRLTSDTVEIGGTNMFDVRPLEFKKTDLGYGGTQHDSVLSCEFGHFWVDANRGQVFNIDQNGRNFKEITVGLQNWFKNNLPFKILNYRIEGLTEDDIDNNFKGLGITMGWDSVYKRVFITKLDYTVKQDYVGEIKYEENEFKLKSTDEVISLYNSTYFEDASFTIAYSPVANSWVSYYSFTPNYYLNFNNYFQTGKNYSEDVNEIGLWSHLLTNKSYNVFYGKKYGWGVELPVKNNFSNNILHSVEYWLDSKRYHNKYDFSENRNVGFDRAYIYNNSNNSGELRLVTSDPNNMYLNSQYPKFENGYSSILATENDFKWTFNDFYNYVDNENNNVPHWETDINNINKNINIEAFNYKRTFADRLRGDWFLIRLFNDNETRYKQIFKQIISKEKTYR